MGLVVVAGKMDELVHERLAQMGEVVEVEANDQDELSAIAPEAVAIAARATTSIGSDLIERATQLRVIGRSGVGTERIDVACASRRGIPVVITPGAGTHAVAEGALALILHLVKRLGPASSLVREGRWDEREALPIRDLDGATLGIVGYGRIGRRLSEIVRPMGMSVVAHDPLVGGHAGTLPAEFVTLRELAARADVISLHAPLTPATRHLVGHDFLARVRPGAILINCGRGALVDLDAVHAALLRGRLSGVGLDVYEPEPPTAHPLFDHAEVVLTPHVLGMSERARRATFEQMVDGMLRVLHGRAAPHVADPETDRFSPGDANARCRSH